MKFKVGDHIMSDSLDLSGIIMEISPQQSGNFYLYRIKWKHNVNCEWGYKICGHVDEKFELDIQGKRKEILRDLLV